MGLSQIKNVGFFCVGENEIAGACSDRKLPERNSVASLMVVGRKFLGNGPVCRFFAPED
jgi:hypothetical protein